MKDALATDEKDTRTEQSTKMEQDGTHHVQSKPEEKKKQRERVKERKEKNTHTKWRG